MAVKLTAVKVSAGAVKLTAVMRVLSYKLRLVNNRLDSRTRILIYIANRHLCSRLYLMSVYLYTQYDSPSNFTVMT